MNQTTTGSEWRVTGRFVFGLLIAFFGVIIAVNVTMAVFASTSWTGLAVENGYVASQHFNSELDQLRRQEKLGWTERLEASNGTLILEVRRQDGSPIGRLDVTAKATRPIGDREDAAIALVETRPGHYESQVALAPGRWQVDITARMSERESFRRIYDMVMVESLP